MPRYKMNAFDRELVQALQNEDLQFDMGYYCVKGKEGEPPSCETALCMAGHIVGTLRPAMAKAFAKLDPVRFIVKSGRYDVNGNYELFESYNYQKLALAIYEAETGQSCTLDFLGHYREGKPSWKYSDLETVPRAKAIAHVRGNSVAWPRIPEQNVSRVLPE